MNNILFTVGYAGLCLLLLFCGMQFARHAYASAGFAKPSSGHFQRFKPSFENIDQFSSGGLVTRMMTDDHVKCSSDPDSCCNGHSILIFAIVACLINPEMAMTLSMWPSFAAVLSIMKIVSALTEVFEAYDNPNSTKKTSPICGWWSLTLREAEVNSRRLRLIYNMLYEGYPCRCLE